MGGQEKTEAKRPTCFLSDDLSLATSLSGPPFPASFSCTLSRAAPLSLFVCCGAAQAEVDLPPL